MTSATFVELEMQGQYLGAHRNSKKKHGSGSRKMSSAGMQYGGFVLTAGGKFALSVNPVYRAASAVACGYLSACIYCNSAL